jgi:single-stranded-DNA-specific exonuclease
MEEATRLAQELDNRNKERQHLEEIVLRAAEEQIREYVNLSTDRTVVVWGEEWHQGVIGIVASRLARRYHRPALVLTRESNGSLCGSGRSIRRVDLVSVLEKCSHCLERFGGHPMAAGLSLTARNLLGFRESFERAVREVLTIEAMRPQLEIVAEVGFDEINERFLTELDMLEPFGHSNPEPVFLAKYVHPQYVTTAGKSHARGSLCDAGGTSLDFIAFGRRPEDLPQPPWNLAYTPQMNRYGGRARPQARVVDIRSA